MICERLQEQHDATAAGGLRHLYPHDPAYRLSGKRPPQPGDIARCGRRKSTPPGHRPAGPYCIVCWDLSARAGCLP